MKVQKKTNPPAAVHFYASPTAFWSMIGIFGSLQFLNLYPINSIIWSTVVAIGGTIPFTLGLMFSPPDVYRSDLRYVFTRFYGKSKENSSDRVSYRNYVKSRHYKLMVLKKGALLALVPYVCYLLSFIDFPETWEVFHRQRFFLERILFAWMFQVLIGMTCLVCSITIYFKKHWATIVSENS